MASATTGLQEEEEGRRKKNQHPQQCSCLCIRGSLLVGLRKPYRVLGLSWGQLCTRQTLSCSTVQFHWLLCLTPPHHLAEVLVLDACDTPAADIFLPGSWQSFPWAEAFCIPQFGLCAPSSSPPPFCGCPFPLKAGTMLPLQRPPPEDTASLSSMMGYAPAHPMVLQKPAVCSKGLLGLGLQLPGL